MLWANLGVLRVLWRMTTEAWFSSCLHDGSWRRLSGMQMGALGVDAVREGFKHRREVELR